ncbi:MAG: SUMF1/EgtB/PvdO family nonheme iron enzyme [Verrucomicrobiota bacterium]
MRFAIWIFSLVWISAAAGQESLTDQSGHKLRRIESGRFLRGFDGGERAMNYAFPLMSTGQFFGNAERPAHWTWITKPFYLATTEITVAQFREFVEDSGYTTSAEQSETGMVGWSPTPADEPLYQSHDFEKKAEFNWRNPGFEQEDDHPVVGVSWRDAQAYCEWLSKKENAIYRLPTEAEWEYAAKGGADTWFSWGDEARNQIHEHANIGNVELEKLRAHATERHWLVNIDKEPADRHVFTAPVGSYKPNGFDLHDMAGNVWEWCQDLYLDTYYQNWERENQFAPETVAADPVNASEPQTEANQFRAIRGGSWYTGPLQTRPANRGFYDEPDGAAYIGFRVVREIPKAEQDAGYSAEIAAMTALQNAGVQLNDRSRDKAYEAEVPSENFSIETLRQLQKIGPVDTINLQDQILVDSAILTEIAKVEGLESFGFSGEFNGNANDLELLPSLKSLRLPRRLSVTDEHLAALAKFDTFEEISVHSPQGGLTDSGIRKIAGNPNLRSLKIYEAELNGSFLEALAQSPLEQLVVYGLTDENAKFLTQFPRLRELDIRNAEIGRAAIEAIATLSNLQRLNLSGCASLTDADCALLAPCQNLSNLDVTGTGAGDLTAAALSKSDQLGEIRIGSDALTDAGMERLSRIMSLQNLTIERAATRITDTGLAELGRLRRLQRLNVYSPLITGSGLKDFPAITSLIEIKLASPALTDEAFEHLSQCDSIIKVRLVDSDVQPAAALTNQGMFQMQRLKNLRELWLPL